MKDKKEDKKKKKKLLNDLEEKMKKDKSLPLQEGATNLVFGVGDADANVMFIGEGPGYWEDKKSEPFVGNAGAFLNQLLYSIKLPREDVYITNVLHYRPPNNRDPKPEELEAFKQPKVIVTLGRFSMGKFLPGVTISNVHGKPKKVIWKGEDLVVLPMYHPAAGLRNGDIKERTKEDFKKIPEVLENLDSIEEEKKEEKKSEQMSLV
jgi:uracil-DNA glycosylase family 4